MSASHYTNRTVRADDDLTQMSSLALANPDKNLHLADLLYRLCSWALDDPANTQLWFKQDGKIAGWAVMQIPFWTVDLCFAPEVKAELFPVALEWADERARLMALIPEGNPCWFIMAFKDDIESIRALETQGFACQADVGENSWSKVQMERSAKEAVPEFRIPKGFTVRPLAGEQDVTAYVELHRSVFESKNMTKSWRARVLHHPAHRPNLDIVVEAPNGDLGAFCIGWMAETAGGERIGQVEPLGCHTKYRNYALGRLALAEVLRSLCAEGVSRIIVETDNWRSTAMRLYESLGFRIIRDVLVYRKGYA